MNKLSYPRLIRRVQAILIDSVILPVSIMLSIYFVAVLGIENVWIKGLAIGLPIFVLEPLIVSFTGGTIGHHLRGIKVVGVDSEHNINIFAAILRFIMKILLGWLSVLTILSSKRHQAMHDFVAGSLVVNKAGSKTLAARDNLSERADDAGYRYPALWLRLLIIFLYVIAAVIVFGVVTSGIIEFAQNCSPETWCLPAIQIALVLGDYLFLALLGVIIVYGWRARLYGCRRKAINDVGE